MSEIVPANLRGGLVELHGLFFQSGFTLSAWIGFGCFFWENDHNWRLPVALQCLWPLPLLCGLMFCPESPRPVPLSCILDEVEANELCRWLVTQGRDNEAKEILEKVHSSSDTGRVLAHIELDQLQRQTAFERELDSSWVQLFRKPSYRKRALLGMGTTGFVQFAGVLVINSKCSRCKSANRKPIHK